MSASDWDDSKDDLHEWEYPDAELTNDESAETIVCPECGADVYEDADQCPACGYFIMHDTNVWSGRSLWWIALALLGIVAVILALGFGL